MTPETLCVHKDRPIREAIACMESGGLQIAFVVDAEGRLEGVVTNGDLRRYFLKHHDSDRPVSACMNRAFHAVEADAPREKLLKIFDLGYHAIPALDAQGRIREIHTRAMSARAESPVLARARAPVRMSFCGGGSDLTQFFIDHAAAVLSCTVALYAHVTLIPRADARIRIFSQDIDREEDYPSLAALQAAPEKGLVATVIAVLAPTGGFDLYLRSDFPVGSGLGGSSAVATATVAAFNELRQDRWNTYDIAELAFQAERLCLGVAGGWQDQYASAFGGLNLIEFEHAGNRVHPIRLEEHTKNELETCLMLVNTGMTHDSNRLHEVLREEWQAESAAGESAQTALVQQNVALCRRMHHDLIRGELIAFGRALQETWRLKKAFFPAASTPQLDRIHDAVLAAGALGGKLLGAGAGGFFLFYVEPQHRRAVIRAVEAQGCVTTDFRFEPQGVTSWRSKISGLPA
ncbi:MAG: CBS domain-containing protein [Zoogloeaceae bacterium]|jgi:D-glycero-alpha-D-manno-heptose-7-phosphate kinase|nr:CBS domain-containing protein [Zoogloeaceae bacterium]